MSIHGGWGEGWVSLVPGPFRGGRICLVPGPFWDGGVRVSGGRVSREWRPLPRLLRILLECFLVTNLLIVSLVTEMGMLMSWYIMVSMPPL